MLTLSDMPEEFRWGVCIHVCANPSRNSNKFQLSTSFFHPTKEYLLVSNSEGRKNINIFQKFSGDSPHFGDTHIGSALTDNRLE
jgi:hypothetical protein